ncbi:hypothetical protein RUND412_001497 [Rhizina undulata]
MEDPSSAESTSASPLSAQEQARIRRERRQAKVKATGTSRLNRITATQGPVSTFRSEESDEPSAAAGTPARKSHESTHEDPPEIDISEHHYEPKSRRDERKASENIFAGLPPPPSSFRNASASAQRNPLSTPSDAELRQMMLDYQSFAGGEDVGFEGMQFDPMMQLFQQMGMGNMGTPGMPGMGPSVGAAPMQPKNDEVDSWGKWWKVAHALCTMFLSLWVITGWHFTGSALQRAESSNLARSEKPQLFWYFTTMELVLQSSRFLLEKGRAPPGSILITIANFLPPPFGTFLSTLARYSVIWTTIMADAGVLIFCLGVAAWWNS